MKLDYCLNIKSPNFASSSTSKEKACRTQGRSLENEDIVSSSEILANQNAAFIKNTCRNFDIESLPCRELADILLCNSIFPEGGGVNISPILSLCSSHIATQARLLEARDTIVPYKIKQIKEESKNRGLSKEEYQILIEEEKQNLHNFINDLKIQALDSFNSANSIREPLMVYRIINRGWDDLSKAYFNNISSLKKNDEVVLDCVPIYVGTSAKEVIKNYASNFQDAILFKINLPAGSKILPVSLGGINQCVMKPDSRFIAADNQEYENNFRVIELDYIPE